MQKLLIRPDQQGFQATEATEAILTQLEGGAPRVRADQLGAYHVVDAQWTLVKPGYYTYWKAFYREATKRGSVPFQIDLILNKAALETYTAYFVPGSIKLLSQVGNSVFIVGAQMLVQPISTTSVADQAIIDGFSL